MNKQVSGLCLYSTHRNTEVTFGSQAAVRTRVGRVRSAPNSDQVGASTKRR